MAVVAGSAVYAATSASGTAKFSVPVAVTLAQGAGGTCPGGACDFGSPALGVLSAGQTEDLTIGSNDGVGFSLSVQALSGANVVESGTSCTPNAAHNVAIGVIQYVPAAATGGTGTGGTPTAGGALAATLAPFFTVNPTMTGTIDDLLTLKVNAPLSTPANSTNCAYVIGYAVVVTAL
jgi:hypothetical protein